MKKLLALIICACVALMSSQALAANEPKVLADSAILVEATTGRIVYEKNSEVERPPASMTKMLTGVLALEKLKPTQDVQADQSVIMTEDIAFSWSTTDLLSARDMITAVLLISENGGAVALAHAVAGSTENFSDMMNDKAKELGCKNSHFVNPNGLPDSNHYSTASDMARIAVYCMKNDTFRQIVSTPSTSIHWINPKDKFNELHNTNRLLTTYKGANGIKTGWTYAAGGCLAASAKRGEIELIAIVMHSPDQDSRFIDAANLLNYGFEHLRLVNAINKEQTEKKILVRGGKKATLRVSVDNSFDFPLMTGEDSKLFEVTYDLPKIVDVGKGIEPGKVLGEAVLRYDGKPIARVPLLAKESIDPGFSFGSLLVNLLTPLIQ